MKLNFGGADYASAVLGSHIIIMSGGYYGITKVQPDDSNIDISEIVEVLLVWMSRILDIPLVSPNMPLGVGVINIPASVRWVLPNAEAQLLNAMVEFGFSTPLSFMERESGDDQPAPAANAFEVIRRIVSRETEIRIVTDYQGSGDGNPLSTVDQFTLNFRFLLDIWARAISNQYGHLSPAMKSTLMGLHVRVELKDDGERDGHEPFNEGLSKVIVLTHGIAHLSLADVVDRRSNLENELVQDMLEKMDNYSGDASHAMVGLTLVRIHFYPEGFIDSVFSARLVGTSDDDVTRWFETGLPPRYNMDWPFEQQLFEGSPDDLLRRIGVGDEQQEQEQPEQEQMDEDQPDEQQQQQPAQAAPPPQLQFSTPAWVSLPPGTQPHQIFDLPISLQPGGVSPVITRSGRVVRTRVFYGNRLFLGGARGVSGGTSWSERRGGCGSSKRLRASVNNMLLSSPRTESDGDCGISVFRDCKVLGIKTWRSDIVRAKCPGISRNGPMTPEEVVMVAAYLQAPYVKVIDQCGHVMCEHVGVPESDIEPFVICLYQGHFWHMVSDLYFARKCQACGRVIKRFHERHRCNVNRIVYRIRHGMQKPLMDRLMPLRRKKREHERLFVVFDMETHPIGNVCSIHVPYAIGYCIIHESRLGVAKLEDDDVCILWGNDECLTQFIRIISGLMENEGREVVLVSFNGAGFDHFFLLQEWIRSYWIRYKFPGFIINGGRIKQITVRRSKLGKRKGGDEEEKDDDDEEQKDGVFADKQWGLRTCDVSAFLPGSLDDCGKAFGCTVHKGSFPHLFLCDTDYLGPEPASDAYPAGRHRNEFIEELKLRPDGGQRPRDDWCFKDECVKYLRNDVLVTLQVFEKLRSVFRESMKTDMEDFVSISQMSFSCWKEALCPIWNIELPQSDLYDFMRRGMYGGRCYNSVRFFDAQESDGNKLVMLDAVSLYPTAMLADEYPCGMGRWASEIELSRANTALSQAHELFYVDNGGKSPVKIGQWTDIHMLMCGIYECDVVPNKRLLDPVLARRDSVTDLLMWDVQETFEQVLCSVDIRSAVMRGYFIRIRRGYVWQSYAAVFKDFIIQNFEVKARGERENNQPLRQAGKLMMNSLYGKMLQRRIDDECIIVSDDKSMSEFLDKHEWTYARQLPGGRTLIAGDKIQVLRENTKPTQLGVFVLAHSRRIWNEIADVLDYTRYFTLPHNVIRYTDTDSWVVPEGCVKRLDFVKMYGDGKLGMVSDDLKGGRITRALFLGPKAYLLEYVMPDGKICSKYRFKGVPGHAICENDFYELASGRVLSIEKSFTAIRKFKTNAPENLEPFSVVNADTRRTMRRTDPRFRVFRENTSIPLGFLSA